MNDYHEDLVINFDETGIFLDMPNNYTLETKG